jgi:ADP-heptose:LPS heptosyltransferase
VSAASDQPIALFLHLGGLGDFILSLRVMDLVARLFPSLECHVVGHAERVELAVGRSSIVRCWSADGLGLHRLHASEGEISGPLADLLARCQVAVSFLGRPDGTFHEQLGRHIAGRLICLDPNLRKDWPGHVTDQWLHDLAKVGFVGSAPAPRLTPTAEDRACGTRTLSDRLGSVVVIHPGSGGLAKCWPLDNYLELADRLGGAGVEAVFMVGPAEMERWPADRLAGLAPHVLSDLGLIEVLQVLTAADAYVGNDSGVTHLAAVLGVPTVAVFGPTSADHWAPLGGHVTVVRGTGDPATPFAGVDVQAVTQLVLSMVG